MASKFYFDYWFLICSFSTNYYSFSNACRLIDVSNIGSLLTATGDRVTVITYKRLEEIGKRLGITGPTEMYKSRIRGTPWHILRINAAYALFTFLIGVYLFLLFSASYVLPVSFLTGFFLILIKEVYSYSERENEKNST